METLDNVLQFSKYAWTRCHGLVNVLPRTFLVYRNDLVACFNSFWSKYRSDKSWAVLASLVPVHHNTILTASASTDACVLIKTVTQQKTALFHHIGSLRTSPQFPDAPLSWRPHSSLRHQPAASAYYMLYRMRYFEVRFWSLPDRDVLLICDWTRLREFAELFWSWSSLPTDIYLIPAATSMVSVYCYWTCGYVACAIVSLLRITFDIVFLTTSNE